MTDDQKPYSKYDVLRRQTKDGNVRQEPKSYAQVESWVSPQGGVTNSGGLKPEEKQTAKKKNTRRRANPLTVRLSEKDRAIIAQKAFSIGYSVNAYVRAAALGSHYKPPIGRDMVMALLAVKRELTAQGRNLNQIAHSHNTNIHSEAETNSMLGVITRSLLKAHEAVSSALTWGKEYPKS
jgi:hypothetical protein